MADSNEETEGNQKSVSKALADFYKKFKRFSKDSEPKETIKVESSLKPLQDQINEREDERISMLRRQMQDYIAPLTSDIEEDEENLTKAYKLFCLLLDAHNAEGDSKTHLKDFSLTSPLCKKTEYTSVPGRFPFLRLWFLIMNPDAMYVPEISAGTGASPDFVLTFIEKDLWQPSLFEKEIMQAIE
jgi:hypothetical protein